MESFGNKSLQQLHFYLNELIRSHQLLIGRKLQEPVCGCVTAPLHNRTLDWSLSLLPAAGFSPDKVPQDLDVIVVGSGIGGLTAAATLAKAGKKVLVLEQHDQAGGCCHTYIEKGFEFDVGKICSSLVPAGFCWPLLGPAGP